MRRCDVSLVDLWGYQVAQRVKPLAIDLYCGLGGWTDGLMAAGYRIVGFDVERHSVPVEEFARPCGDGWETASTKSKYYPAQLVLQDVLTLHGSQFRDAAVIVASPPCQNYSYLAMPWSKSPDEVRPCGDGWEILNSASAKELREKWEREGPDNRLFDACFRIQREAIEATACVKCRHASLRHDAQYGCGECEGHDVCSRVVGRYIPLIVENVCGAQPWVGRSAWNYGSFHLWADVPALMPFAGKDAIKQGGDWFGPKEKASMSRRYGSKSKARKMEVAKSSKIPFEVAAYIARCYYPRGEMTHESANQLPMAERNSSTASVRG